MNRCLNTTPKHYIPLFPPPSLLQGMDNIVDLSPRCSIEAATRQELLDDDRVNTVAIQEYNDCGPIRVGEVRLCEDHPPQRAWPSVRRTDKVLQHD